jgi:hypothetical protein
MTRETLDLAREYLLSTRRRDAESPALERRLAVLDPLQLRREVADDAARLAFWIDIYNGAVQRHPVRADGPPWERLRYFRRPAVEVAGRTLSLDAIEHGLLRRSRWLLGLGYLPNPLPGRFERSHRVERVDPRIHFALNCGVASCPPIAAYSAELIDEQLDRATRGYLQAEIDRDGRALVVPALLLWYAGDFGGARGIRAFLREHGVQGWHRPIRFKRYDWTPAPDRWAAHPD